MAAGGWRNRIIAKRQPPTAERRVRNADDSTGHSKSPLRRKAAVGEPDHEHSAPFQTFGLMHRGENNLLVLWPDHGHIFARERIGQSYLFEERVDIVVAQRV